jgi:hypothetical protein
MEKYVQIYFELSEEQLQDITGGCRLCEGSLIQIKKLQNAARTDLDRVTQNPNRADANLLLNRATRNLSTADLHFHAIIVSGHVDVSKLPLRS